MRYCSLGHANGDGSDFCASCGQQLLAPSPPPAPTPPQPQQPPQPPPGYGYGMPPYGATNTQGGPPPNPWAAPPAPSGWQSQPMGAAPASSSRRWWFIGGGAAIAVLALALVFALRGGSDGGGFIPPDTKTLTVTLDVYTDDFSGCDLGLGYYDVPGSIVVVEVDGEVVGKSELGEYGSDEGVSCQFTARVPDVPTDGTFYEISIGSRGTGDATKSELESNGWTYSASLGL